MKVLLAIVIALAMAWAGYWFAGSAALKSGTASWFEARKAEGWIAEYDDLSVRGFPNRFDTTFTAPALSDPSSDMGWRAPFFQLMTLSYRPNHVIAIWPPEQQVEMPSGDFTLGSRDMRASLVVAPSTALELQRSTLTAGAISATPADGSGALSAAGLRLAAVRLDDPVAHGAARYHLGLAAQDVAPPAALMQRIDPKGVLGRVAEAVRADLTVDFDAPWDRSALEGRHPQPTRVAVRSASIDWGDMRLDASGTLNVDIGGRPNGIVSVTARGWRKMLQVAADAQWITRDLAKTAAQTLAMMSAPDGDGNSLTVSLNFRGERIWLGPIPIARSPVLRLR